MHQTSITNWLKSTKKFPKVSLKIIKAMAGSKNMTLKIWKLKNSNLIETKPLSDESKSDIKQPVYKSLWFKINIKEFEELTGDIYINQDNNNFEIIINKKTYHLKNAKKIGWK